MATAAEDRKASAPGRLSGPTFAELSQLKEKHRELRELRAPDAVLVVRQFKEAEWDRFQTQAEAGQGARALKDILAACVVWSSESMESLLERRPAYGKKFGMALVEWCAGGEQLEKNDL